MLATILSYFLIYTYPVLFLVTFLAALILPLPSGTLTMAAGAFASQGYLNFNYVILVATLGNVLGDLTGYFISFYFGRDFLIKIGFKKIIESKKYVFLEHNFTNHVSLIIFFTRSLFAFLGSTVNILSGLSKVSFKKFFIFDLLGEISYVLFFAVLGYIFGIEWEGIHDIAQWAYSIVSIIFVIIILKIIYSKINKSTN